MQKFLFLLCMVVLHSLQLRAQISTFVAEKYKHWMVVKAMNCNYMPPGATGSSQTWDFTTLTPKVANDTARVQYMPRESSLPFPTADVVLRSGNSFTFYEHKTDGVYEIGMFDSATLDTIFYPNSKYIMKHPIGYLGQYTDSFSVVEAGDTAWGVFTDAVESFGILKLPVGTYENVIRMRIEESLNGMAGGNPVNIHRVSYRWYDKDHASPLLRLDSLDINGVKSRQAVYLIEEDAVMISDVAVNPIDVSALFSGNELVITSNTEAGQEYELVLYNLSGAKTYQSTFTGGQQQQRFEINTTVIPGLYVLIVNKPDKHDHAGITKLIKP